MELFEDPDFLSAQQKMKEVVRVRATRESLKIIVKASPKKFLFVFFTIILPLSWFQFLLETKNLNLLGIFFEDQYYKSSPEYDQHANSFLPFKQIAGAYSISYCVYLVMFFTFYLLSISAITFTVASIYLSKPSSCISVLTTIPGISKRVAITFLHVLPLILLHCTAYLAVLILLCAILTLIRMIPKIDHVLVYVIAVAFGFVYGTFIFIVQGHFIAWCNLANVISVLEPKTYGSAAIEKSKQVLQEKILNTRVLAFLYLSVVYAIVSMANWVMGDDMDNIVRVLISLLPVMALAVVNFLGLTAQNIMYYQNQVIGNGGVSSEGAAELEGSVGDDGPVEGGDHLEV